MINKLLGEPYVDELIRLIYTNSKTDASVIISLQHLSSSKKSIMNHFSRKDLIAFSTTPIFSDVRKINLATIEEVVSVYKGFERNLEDYILDNLYMFDKKRGVVPALFQKSHWQEWSTAPNSERYLRLGVVGDGNLANLIPLWMKR